MNSGKRILANALDVLPLSTALFGPNLAYLGCNEAFSSLFLALSETKPGGGGKSPLSFFDLRLPFSLSSHIATFLSGRQVTPSVEDGLHGVDGKYHWLKFRLSRYPLEGGGDGALLVIEDLSHQKTREDELSAAKDEAVRNMALRSRFIANMSHEIRTPIQTILGMIELLEDTDLDHEQEEYVRQVSFSADVLLSLINDILDFSKIEAGKLALEAIDFNLRDCIEQSADMIALEAHRKGLELVLDIDEGLPAIVNGDPTRLRQVMVNLIKNAVKFTSSGEVRVRALPAVDRDGRVRVRVEVSDTGIGLTPEIRAKLFSSYYQGDSSHTRKYGGTGLGLSISKHLIERMGGDIGVLEDSSPGATFFFEVPLARPSFSLPDEAARFSGRMLIVDDSEAAGAAEVSMAASFGLAADRASSGAQALERLTEAAERGEPYDLCAVDQNMPGMDGWRLAAEISSREGINAVKLVLLSPEGSLGADAKMKLLNWFNGYVAKPVKSRRFRETIARALGAEMDLEPAGDDEPVIEPSPVFASAVALVAEDHPVNQALFRVILERSGCEVLVAKNGREAVELSLSRHLDIVFMDIQMPLMNGYEAARAIRDSGERMPIVAVTANSGRDERAKCLESGMNDILVKPFRKKDINMMLGFWLKHGVPNEGSPSAKAPDEPAERAPVGWFSDLEVFDFDQVLETFLGDEDTVVGLLSKFISRTKESVRAIDAAGETGDRETISREAHSIKGSALNLSALRMGRACASLEEAAKSPDDRALEEAIELLREEFFEFAQYAQYYVTKSG